MKFTLRDEAAKNDLCRSCSESLIITDGRGEHKFCHLCHPPMLLHGPVTACTDYTAKHQMQKHEMEKVAWVLNVNKKGDIIGFRAPQKKEDD